MEPTYTAEDFVEIYRAESLAEAMRLRDVVLVPQGVEAMIHDRMDHAFPAPATQPGMVTLAVPAPQRERAYELIREFLAGSSDDQPAAALNEASASTIPVTSPDDPLEDRMEDDLDVEVELEEPGRGADER